MYKDITTHSKNDTKREPSVLENETNGIRFTVHKYIGMGEAWFLSCNELGIKMMDLKTEDMGKAKEKAIIEMKYQLNRKIEKYLDAISSLN